MHNTISCLGTFYGNFCAKISKLYDDFFLLSHEYNNVYLFINFTGGHFYFHMSSKAKCLDKDTVQLLKFASWATSAGQADWYVIQTLSPGFAGDYSDFSCFLVFKVSHLYCV